MPVNISPENEDVEKKPVPAPDLDVDDLVFRDEQPWQASGR